MLSNESIKEYQKIYKKKFGEEISYEGARKQGTDLVELMKLVYKPIKKSELKK